MNSAQKKEKFSSGGGNSFKAPSLYKYSGMGSGSLGGGIGGNPYGMNYN